MKTLANRLKYFLDPIISPTQSTFDPNRLITDNIIVDFELFHSLSRKTNGKKGWTNVKLDMNKASECVE